MAPATVLPDNCLISRLYSDEGFDSSKSVYTAKLKELTDLGNPVESRLYETNHRQVSLSCLLQPSDAGGGGRVGHRVTGVLGKWWVCLLMACTAVIVWP